jgi:hypothetical protein
MTVHMIRFTTVPSATLQQWVSAWLTNKQAWTEADNRPPEERTTLDGTAHYREDWRFAWEANSKTVLLDDLVTYSQTYADWGRIGYHECDHDENERAGCTMNTEAEWGTIPDGI